MNIQWIYNYTIDTTIVQYLYNDYSMIIQSILFYRWTSKLICNVYALFLHWIYNEWHTMFKQWTIMISQWFPQLLQNNHTMNTVTLRQGTECHHQWTTMILQFPHMLHNDYTIDIRQIWWELFQCRSFGVRDVPRRPWPNRFQNKIFTYGRPKFRLIPTSYGVMSGDPSAALIIDGGNW
jgi:hypothetical protein